MLRVTVELVPFGDESRKKEIGQMVICNDGESILVHGHTHSPEKVKGRMIHVGVDAWDYKPVSHQKILELIKQIKNG